jgi:hypothetical protein
MEGTHIARSCARHNFGTFLKVGRLNNKKLDLNNLDPQVLRVMASFISAYLDSSVEGGTSVAHALFSANMAQLGYSKEDTEIVLRVATGIANASLKKSGGV